MQKNNFSSQSGWLQTLYASWRPAHFLQQTINLIQPPQWGFMLLKWLRCFSTVVWGLVVFSKLATPTHIRTEFRFKMSQSEFNKVREGHTNTESFGIKRTLLTLVLHLEAARSDFRIKVGPFQNSYVLFGKSPFLSTSVTFLHNVTWKKSMTLCVVTKSQNKYSKIP